MTRTIGYRWMLRDRMAEHGLWKTTQLTPLLAERGIALSPAQVHRLVTQTPERLSLTLLAALCDIFGCEPGELVACRAVETGQRRVAGGEDLGDPTALRAVERPRRARVDPGQR